jgi:hypothetical protein
MMTMRRMKRKAPDAGEKWGAEKGGWGADAVGRKAVEKVARTISEKRVS